MAITKENLGKKIRGERKKTATLQNKWASKLGIDPKTLNRIERGIRYPSLPVLMKFAQLVHQPIEYFLTED